MSTLPVSSNKRRALYRSLLAGLLLAISALAVESSVFDMHLHALATVLMLAALVLSVLQFQSLDEVAKQAQYVAWFWGSMTAITLVGALFAVFYALPETISAPVEDLLVRGLGEVRPGEAFLAGAITTPLLMVAGFSVWWAVYWLRRR